MLRHGFLVAAQTLESPLACRVRVGHGFQSREGLRRDDKKGFGWIKLQGRFRKISSVHIRNKTEFHAAVAVELQCLVGHDRAEIGAADTNVDYVANPFSGVAFPRAAADTIG